MSSFEQNEVLCNLFTELPVLLSGRFEVSGMVTEPQRDFVAVPIQLVRHSRFSQITNNIQLELLSTTFFLFVSFFTFKS